MTSMIKRTGLFLLPRMASERISSMTNSAAKLIRICVSYSVNIILFDHSFIYIYASVSNTRETLSSSNLAGSRKIHPTILINFVNLVVFTAEVIHGKRSDKNNASSSSLHVYNRIGEWQSYYFHLSSFGSDTLRYACIITSTSNISNRKMIWINLKWYADTR